MELYTRFSFEDFDSKIDFQSNILTIGSCFSDEIGIKLKKDKFKVEVNPLGTVFNPISIFRFFGVREINENHFFEVDGLFYHHDFHSTWKSNSSNELMKILKTQIENFQYQLNSADFLIITFGTAWVYELNTDSQIIANCHKRPQSEFKKRLLTIDEIVSTYQNIKSKIPTQTKILLSISPVRHTRDGIPQNQLSKSMLRVAIDEILKNDSRTSYLPVYEKFIDELRDYRFYKPDMIHPTDQAVEMIYQEFCSVVLDDQSLEIQKKWKKLKLALEHKSENGTLSQKHLQFIEKEINDLKVVLDLKNEIEALEKIKMIASEG